jgi:hypothetical protein
MINENESALGWLGAGLFHFQGQIFSVIARGRYFGKTRDFCY